MKKKLFFLFAQIFLFVASISAQTGGNFTIGGILALTGPAHVWGKYARMGAELAVEEANEQGGAGGQKINLVIEDSQSKPTGAVTAFNTLRLKANPRVMFGDVWTQLDEPLIALASRAKLVLFAPTIVPWTVQAPGEYFLTMGQKPETASQAVSSFFDQNPAIKTVSIFCWDNTWGHSYLKIWKQETKRRSIKILNEQCVNDFGYDYRTDAAKVVSAKPDAVIIAHFSERILKLLAEQNFRPKVLSTSNIVEVLHDGSLPSALAEGVYYTDWPPSREFAQKFESRYHEKPILESHNSYETISSILKAAASGRPELREGLKTVHYEGVAGPIDFRSSFAGNDADAKLMVVKNGAGTEAK